MASEQSNSNWPYIWLGAFGVMLLALLVGIFGGGSERGSGSLGSSEVAAILGDSDSRGGSDASSDEGYTVPDVGDLSHQILTANQSGGLAASFSVQDMLDGNGFDATTVALAAEEGRERTGVLLGALLERAGIEDWNRLRILGALGDVTDVDRATFDADSDQFLLYWSDDDDPSPTVSLTNPTDQVSVTDVTNIVVLE